MLKRTLVLVMVAGAMVLVGCGDSGDGSSGRVAVVDLNKIAKDIGEQDNIETAAKVRASNLQKSVRDLSQDAQNQLIALAKEIGDRPKAEGDEPTEAEKKALEEWTTKARNLERARLDATNRLRQAFNQQQQANRQAYANDINKIRDRIKPLAMKAAKDKGMDIVVTSSQVLDSAEKVDITEEVLEKVIALQQAGSFPKTVIPPAYTMKVRPTTLPKTGP